MKMHSLAQIWLCPLLNEAKRFMKEYGYISPASRKRVVEGLAFPVCESLVSNGHRAKIARFHSSLRTHKTLEAGPRLETEMVVAVIEKVKRGIYFVRG